MRIAVALLCCLAVATASSYGSKKADKNFILRNIKLDRLFLRTNQPNLDQEQRQLGNSFNLVQQANQFTNQNAVRQFQAAYQAGKFLPRGEVFNYNNPNQLQQAIYLFDLFYFAKDYNTFYQVATWARDRINEGQFVYALNVALLNRPDTEGTALFRPSELYPSLYVNARAIQQARTYKQQQQKQAVLQSNLTYNYPYYQQQQYYQQQEQQNNPFDNEYQNQDGENQANQYQNQNQYNQDGRISYYNEDVNLNQQFAYEQLKNPAWFDNQKYQKSQQNQNQNNGENFYYYLQQALARYNLERNANGLPNVQPFQFNQNIQPGYNPQLQYDNGQAVAARPNNVDVNNANNNYLEQFKNIDRRVADAVDKNKVESADGSKVQLNEENGVEVLGSIVQNNGNSPNNQYYAANNGFYGYLDQCRRVVGSIVYNGNSDAPAAIENDNTANRDPAFYQCVSRVVNYFQKLKNQQKPYNKDKLNFQGVKVQSVNSEKLITYFDQSEVPLFNAIDYLQSEKPYDFSFKAQQYRLNYKPFSYQIQVNSDKNANAVVRVFIGPKYDAQGQQYSLEQARQNFVEIDRFTTKLVSGQNNIQRSSQQSTRFTQQQNDFSTQYSKLYDALKGGAAYYYNENPSQVEATFPKNLILPKGSRNGQEYVFAVAVNSYEGNAQDQDNQQNLPQQQPNDNRPQGFPFDRVVREANFQQADNIYFQTVKVYNKNQKEVNNPDN